MTGSSTWFKNVLLDWITKDAFGLQDCDVISNSGNHVFYSHLTDRPADNAPRVGIAQHLIAQRIPNYLTPAGPYHESLEELRNHRFLEDMRRYLDGLLLTNDRLELKRVSEELVRLAHEHRDRIFRRFLAEANEYWVIGKAAITDTAGLLLPGIGTVRELITASQRKKERQELRWAGFITDLNLDVPVSS